MSTLRKKFTSPYASWFKTGIKSGTPFWVVINNIARKTGKPAGAIIKSLTRAGWCYCQKFNGNWICWPTFPCRSAKWSTGQANLWQCFVDWCCASGASTPRQLKNKSGSQAAFMSACRGLWSKFFAATGPSAATKSKSRKSSPKRRAWKPSSKRRASSRTTWARHSRKHTRKSSPRRSTSWRRGWSRSTSYR